MSEEADYSHLPPEVRETLADLRYVEMYSQQIFGSISSDYPYLPRAGILLVHADRMVELAIKARNHLVEMTEAQKL